MRLISTLSCHPGMRLGKPIISSKGITLLGYHVELTQWTIQKLSSMGYEYLCIDDPMTDDIVIREPVREETKMFARAQLEQIYNTFRDTSNTQKLSAATIQCLKIVQMIINDLKEGGNEMCMVNLGTKAGDPEQNFIQNALNVCIYATKLGMIQHYPSDDLVELSIGALLHNLGNVQLPENLLHKQTKMTPQEYAIIQKHTVSGYQLLKGLTDIPISSAFCALQHHERMDGGGYPLKLQEPQIHPHAKWIGLLDAYDSMTCPKTHRKAMLPHEALEVLYACAGTLYDKKKVEIFRNKVAIYPVGISVQLHTGETGIVSKVKPECKQRPIIRVLRNSSGEKIRHPYEIDLSQQLNIIIKDQYEEKIQGVG